MSNRFKRFLALLLTAVLLLTALPAAAGAQGTDGGDGAFYVHPDGNVSWSAVASDPSWIVVFGDTSGTGYGTVQYIVAPYVGTGGARTGWITVGDKKIYITQRAYDLSISPNGTWVTGNSGEGEFGVSASIGDVSHLYAAGVEPSFAARFCETYGNGDRID